VGDLGPGIEIAARNSRGGITVAGTVAALDSLAVRAQERGWRCMRLDLDYAFHSSQLDGIRDDLLSDIGAIDARNCGDRFVSTVTGGALAGSLVQTAYWWRNVREPALFAHAARSVVARGIRRP
jgi:acyl transferase domain-containing protein